MKRIVTFFLALFLLLPPPQLHAAKNERKDVHVHKHSSPSGSTYIAGGLAVLFALYGLYKYWWCLTPAKQLKKIIVKQDELKAGQERVEESQQTIAAGVSQMHEKADILLVAQGRLEQGHQQMQAMQKEAALKLTSVQSGVDEVRLGVTQANGTLSDHDQRLKGIATDVTKVKEQQTERFAALDGQQSSCLSILTSVQERQGNHTQQLNDIQNSVKNGSTKLEQLQATMTEQHQKLLAVNSAALVGQSHLADFAEKLKQEIRSTVDQSIKESLKRQMEALAYGPARVPVDQGDLVVPVSGGE